LHGLASLAWYVIWVRITCFQLGRGFSPVSGRHSFTGSPRAAHATTRALISICALATVMTLGACQRVDTSPSPDQCAWAPEPASPAERWRPMSEGRTHSFLSHHAGFDVSRLSEIEGCTLSMFMSGVIVVRFRAASEPSLASWTGTPAPDRAERELKWLRAQLRGLDLPSEVAPLGLEQRDEDGDFDELSLYRYADDGPTYLFVFSHAG
jgi:hypothetical protein